MTDSSVLLAEVTAYANALRDPAQPPPPIEPLLVPTWMWDQLETRGLPWFTAARDAGLLIRNPLPL